MAHRSPHPTIDLPLHVCPVCGSFLIQPTLWEQAGDRSHWRVGRRCPECEWTCESVHDATEIDAFDEQLELGAQELGDELAALEHANMGQMATSFAIALEHDLITADDFG